MSSDKSQTQVGGSAAAPGQMGAREGAMTSKEKRELVAEASVDARKMDDIGAVLDKALASVFASLTDGELKNLSGEKLLEAMRYDPLIQAKSGTAWAQVSIAKAGLDKELDKLIEGTPVVDERQAKKNIENLMSSKTLVELSPIQVKFLQDNLKELGLYSGKTDGDFTNPAMVASLDNLVKKEAVLQKGMDRNGGRAMIDFVWAMRNETPKLSKAEPVEESATLKMFRANRAEITATPVAALVAATPALRPQELRPSV